MMRDAVVVSAVRAAVGKARKGTLGTTRADEMGAAVIKESLARVPGLETSEVEDVIMGCAMPEAEQGMNVARSAAIRAGLPVETSAMTINRFCSSGLQSIAMAADRIKSGGAEVIVAGGLETMSMIPMGGHIIRPNPYLVDHYPDFYLSMGLATENVARKYEVTREQQDEFALRSHTRATAGCPPEEMGIGPVFAIPKALKLAGLTLNDIDVIELNEAFAAQSIAVIKTLGLDPDKVNVNGGAIALGHPLGCTGAKLTASLLRELQRRNGRYGMATMCVGGGMGAAGILERL